MTEHDGYEHGVPCWVDTWQDDPDTAATFYAGVFGWEVEKGTATGTDTRYYMCRLRGSDVAAIGSYRCAARMDHIRVGRRRRRGRRERGEGRWQPHG